jgi:SLIT-ROBO Rho GTPase activating protein
MDIGFHQSLSQALLMHLSGMEQCQRSLQQDVDSLSKALSAMDSRLDKQRFIESNNTTFMIPKKFEYAPVRRDEVRQPDRCRATYDW